MSDELPFHEVETTQKTFDELGLHDDILEILSKVGFEHPTPIQAQVIPIALSGKDIFGCAQTGTGKTAAFVLPLAEQLTHGHGLRGLILCPTREIAQQTDQFLRYFGQGHKLKSAIIIGGVRFGPQLAALKDHPDIVVATPGRLLDHAERGNVILNQVEKLILDEADRMLDMGFYPQIERILNQLPKKRQTMLFSATLPSTVESLARQFMKDPVPIHVAPPGTAAEGIEHRLYLIEEKDREAMLLELVRAEPGTILVFTQTKKEVDYLTRLLNNQGEPADTIHSDLTQAQRKEALEGFRSGKHQVLVATDILARGVDVVGIAQVINYRVPEDAEDYIHRAGRTARAKSTGVSSIIASWRDKGKVAAVEGLVGQSLPRCTMPKVNPYVELSTGRKRSRLRF